MRIIPDSKAIGQPAPEDDAVPDPRFPEKVQPAVELGLEAEAHLEDDEDAGETEIDVLGKLLERLLLRVADGLDEIVLLERPGEIVGQRRLERGEPEPEGEIGSQDRLGPDLPAEIDVPRERARDELGRGLDGR